MAAGRFHKCCTLRCYAVACATVLAAAAGCNAVNGIHDFDFGKLDSGAAVPESGTEAAAGSAGAAGSDASEEPGNDAEEEPSEDQVSEAADAPDTKTKCTSNDDCSAVAGKPLCDQPSGRCGACLPSADTCGLGLYCSETKLECLNGCKSDLDCVSDPQDAGSQDAGGLKCNTSTHQCEGCAGDADCPLGSLCANSQCVPGCTPQHGCKPGSTCCTDTCLQTDTDVLNCGTCGNACPAVAHGTPGCAAATCGVASCDTGFHLSTGQCVPDGCATQAVAGHNHACALRNDGSVWCWGQQWVWPAGHQPGGRRLDHSSSGVSVGDGRICARSLARLCDGGEEGRHALVLGVERRRRVRDRRVLAGDRACARSRAWHHFRCVWRLVACMRDRSGRVFVVLGIQPIRPDGQRLDGQLRDDTHTDRRFCECHPGLRRRGTHVCTHVGRQGLVLGGGTRTGQIGDGKTTGNVTLPYNIASLGSNVAEVACGQHHSCARKADGTVWCWGRGSSGQIGTGTTATNNPTPVQLIAFGANGTQLAAWGDFTCARKGDGTLWCWGSNSSGQLGTGVSGGQQNLPVQATTAGSNVTSVVTGLEFTCVRRIDDTLWCWGVNTAGQLGDGTTDSPKLSAVKVQLPCP